MAAIIAAIVVGVLFLLLLVAVVQFQRYRKKRYMKRAAKVALGAHGFDSLLEKATTDPSSKDARRLSLLREAAQNVIQSGKKMDALPAEVKALLKEKNHLDPALSATLADEWYKMGMGSSPPTEAEKIELLKMLLNPPLQPIVLPDFASVTPIPVGFHGGGGLRMPPPKLLPVQGKGLTLPPQVIDEAHRIFEQRHGRKATSDHAALLALRESLEPYAKLSPVGQMPAHALAAAECFDVEMSQRADGESQTMDSKSKLNALRTALDRTLKLVEEEAAMEAPPDLAFIEGNVIGDTPVGAGGGSGVRLRPPPLKPAEKLSQLEAEAEEAADQASEEPKVIADVPLARLPRGMTHATARIPDGGGVRLAPPKLQPLPQDSFWEAAMEAEVEKAPDEVETVLNEEALEGTVEVEDVEANQGGGVRLKPPPLKAVSSIEGWSLPPKVIDEARALTLEQTGNANATDEECLAVLRDTLRPKLTSQRSRSSVRLAPNLGLFSAAEAFASSTEGEDRDPDEVTKLRRQGSSAMPDKMMALMEEVDRTIHEKEDEWKEDRLDRTRLRPGFNGGGGVRLRPPKLFQPSILQPPPLAPGLKVALETSYADRFSDNLTGTRDVEEMGMKLVEEVDPFTNLKNTAALAQKREKLYRAVGKAQAVLKARRIAAESSESVRLLRASVAFAADPANANGFQKSSLETISDPEESLAPIASNGRHTETKPSHNHKYKALEDDTDSDLLQAAQAVSNDAELLGALVGPKAALHHTEAKCTQLGVFGSKMFRALSKGQSIMNVKKTEKERLIDVEMPSDISNAELSAELSAEKSQARAEIKAVDRQRALENRRAQAEARRASVANARQEYAKAAQEQANARPAEEDSINLKAREEIKAVDKNVARQNMQKKAQARREAIQRAREERAAQRQPSKAQVVPYEI